MAERRQTAAEAGRGAGRGRAAYWPGVSPRAGRGFRRSGAWCLRFVTLTLPTCPAPTLSRGHIMTASSGVCYMPRILLRPGRRSPGDGQDKAAIMQKMMCRFSSHYCMTLSNLKQNIKSVVSNTYKHHNKVTVHFFI